MNLRQDHFACYDLGMASERFPDCTFGFNAQSAMESLTECPSPASSQSNSVGLLSWEKSDVRGNRVSEESLSDMSGGERLFESVSRIAL